MEIKKTNYKKDDYMILRNVLIRIGYIAICLLVARFAYIFIYDGIISYLPDYSMLDKYANYPTAEITTFRKQYIDAFKDSMSLSLIISLACFALLEYIHRIARK
jgi:ABC-type spermidine/putrescine transport system permease subunit I